MRVEASRADFGRLAIKSLGLELHLLGVFPGFLNAQMRRQPERLAPHEALDVLAPDQRQVVAEPPLVEIDQHVAVAHFLLGHLVEDLGGGGKIVAQSHREPAVDAAVLVLGGNGQRQDFLLGEIAEAFQCCLLREPTRGSL